MRDKRRVKVEVLLSEIHRRTGAPIQYGELQRLTGFGRGYGTGHFVNYTKYHMERAVVAVRVLRVLGTMNRHVKHIVRLAMNAVPSKHDPGVVFVSPTGAGFLPGPYGQIKPVDLGPAYLLIKVHDNCVCLISDRLG